MDAIIHAPLPFWLGILLMLLGAALPSIFWLLILWGVYRH